MQLTYTLQGVSQTLAIAGDDIPALLCSAEHQLQAQHPALTADPHLPIRIADGLLNSLAENAEVVQLGELVSANPAPN